jgi:hypothetical protein
MEPVLGLQHANNGCRPRHQERRQPAEIVGGVVRFISMSSQTTAQGGETNATLANIPLV